MNVAAIWCCKKADNPSIRKDKHNTKIWVECRTKKSNLDGTGRCFAALVCLRECLLFVVLISLLLFMASALRRPLLVFLAVGWGLFGCRWSWDRGSPAAPLTVSCVFCVCCFATCSATWARCECEWLGRTPVTWASGMAWVGRSPEVLVWLVLIVRVSVVLV